MLSQCCFSSFAGVLRRIWIVGSSIIKYVFLQARQSSEGVHLNLQRHNGHIWWQGRSGLRCGQLRGFIAHLLTLEDSPDILVLHAGGNDIGQIPLADLRLLIFRTLQQLRILLPCTKFIWSQILPRIRWRNELDHAALERVRLRINSYAATLVVKLGGGYLRYPELSGEDHAFFLQDGVHLSRFANELFLYRMQQGLQSFLTSDIIISPSAGEFGPWLVS